MFSFNPFHSFTNKTSQHDPALQQLLEGQKKLTSHWLLLADEQRITANDLIVYGRPLGEDLTDVTSKMGSLMIKWSEIMANFAGSYDQYQLTLKSIAERESSLYSSREKKNRLQEIIAKMEQDYSASADKLADLKQQLSDLNEATAVDEREMDNFKRVAVREAFYLLLNGMHEMASKTDVISSFGKYIVDELDVTPVKEGEERQAYRGSEQTTRILSDATYAMEHWKPDGTKVRRTLTSHHNGRNPLVSKNKALPPPPTEAETAALTESARNTNSDSNDKESQIDTNDSSSTTTPESPQLSPELSPQPDKEQPLRQPSVHSLHKPDEVEEINNIEDDNESNDNNNNNEDDLPLAPMSPRPQSASIQDYPYPAPPHSGRAGGFSTVYLGLPDHQKLYQFYTNYAPPKSYEEMSHILSPQAVFHPSPQQKHLRQPVSSSARMDAGGFALPSGNHANYFVPQPSVSSSSVSSVKSNHSSSSQGSQREKQIVSSPPSSSTSSSASRRRNLESKVSALRAKFQAD